jgi:hypothetical protein
VVSVTDTYGRILGFLGRLCTAKELKFAPTLEMFCERYQVSSFSSGVHSPSYPMNEGVLSSRANQSGHGVDCWPSFGGEFRNAFSYASNPKSLQGLLLP